MAKFKIVIYEGEDGQYVTECPELPGCISQGKTKTDALKNIKEAIGLYIETVHASKPVRKVDFLDIIIPA